MPCLTNSPSWFSLAPSDVEESFGLMLGHPQPSLWVAWACLHCKSCLFVQQAFTWGMADSLLCLMLSSSCQSRNSWDGLQVGQAQGIQPSLLFLCSTKYTANGPFLPHHLHSLFRSSYTQFQQCFQGRALSVDIPCQKTIKFTCFVLFWTSL